MLITMEKMAKELDVTYGTLYHLTVNNKVPHYRVGRAYRFDRKEVLKTFRVHPVQTGLDRMTVIVVD